MTGTEYRIRRRRQTRMRWLEHYARALRNRRTASASVTVNSTSDGLTAPPKETCGRAEAEPSLLAMLSEAWT